MAQMNVFLERHRVPLNLAHRGASAYAPENTLAAFNLAAEMGADGIELDVVLTRDSEIVVIHDETVDRTTDGSGHVSDFTLAQIKRLDAGSKFDARFADERVPMLKEVIETVGDRLLLNVELKPRMNFGGNLEDKVVDLILRCGLSDRIMVSSFNPFALRRVKRNAPQIVCGLLYHPSQPLFLRRAWLARLVPGLEAHHPYYEMINLGSVRNGRRVGVWVVNDEAEMRRMIDLGVYAIMTDRPDVLERVCRL